MNSHEFGEPSGNDAFDRARHYLERFREAEALDWFEIAANEAEDADVRSAAAAFAAGLLLREGRPWEVASWAEVCRSNASRRDLGDLLEAAACLQLDDVAGARALLASVDDPGNQWFPISANSARMMRAHVAYLDDDVDSATSMVLDVFDADPFAPDVWDAFARLCAETDFDPTLALDRVPDESMLTVLASMRNSEATGVDRIAQLIWERNPGDPRVLALVPRFAPKLESLRAMEWSARLRAAGMGRLCPLLERAADVRVDAPERARAAALAFASFGDKGAREAIETIVPVVDDETLAPVLREVWSIAGMLTDSVVVAGATTPKRSLLIADVLYQGGARAEAYSVLVHGLAMEAAEGLTTEMVVQLLPVPVLEGLAAEAETRGEDDVAGILEAVAVVATEG
ncbi:MAG TPA: hypothetical protein VNC41_12525 [Acidimicrobiia bacterium]|nr:hypothetical protein [Acidimicrobiia bacterium]